MAENLAMEIVLVTGYAPFKQVNDDLKPAAQNALKGVMEKIKTKAGSAVVYQQPP